jgi:hypothetical protein
MEERMTLKLKLLKILFVIYGSFVFLISATYIILLYVHEDLLVIKAPTNLGWIAGELVLILQMLWGISVAFSTMIKWAAGRRLALLSLLLALIINVLVGWINWKMGFFLGVPLVIFLHLLPSLLLIGTQNTWTPPGDAPSLGEAPPLQNPS